MTKDNSRSESKKTDIELFEVTPDAEEHAFITQDVNSESEPKQTTADKGYNLPIPPDEQAEAEEDCLNQMKRIQKIYEKVCDGDPSNLYLTKQTLIQMQKEVSKTGVAVYITGSCSNMENYDPLINIIKELEQEKPAEIAVYEVNLNGGLNRKKIISDGDEIYVLNTHALFNESGEPYISLESYARIKEWNYTLKGWLVYDVCVPEPPEVTEVVNGTVMFRVKPLNKEYRELADRYLVPVSYQGNNLFSSNWDKDHMEELDYNGLYESLYEVKYEKEFDGEQYVGGIPQAEFEDLMTEYLPVTKKQVETYAVLEEDKKSYGWARLGCLNHDPNFFGIATPEITEIQDNKDGTETLVIDAVSQTTGNDCCITHRLTVRLIENGQIQYLKNEVEGDGLDNIPAYQYRVK